MQSHLTKLLSFLLVLCLSFPPVKGESKVFLAVFCNPGWERAWQPMHPDIIYTAKTWEDLPRFLDEVAAKNDGTELEIDIDCHAIPTEFALQYPAFPGARELETYTTTAGYICNQITDHHFKNLTVFTEACFSGAAYKNTLRYPFNLHLHGDVKEGYKYAKVDFPFYGVGDCYRNRGIFIYLQHHHHMEQSKYFHDLREYENRNLAEPRENDLDPDNLEILYLLNTINAYGV